MTTSIACDATITSSHPAHVVMLSRSEASLGHMVLTMDLSEQPPELRENIIQIATEWCQQHFKQETVQIREICEIATPYPNQAFGFRVIVVMPDHPQGEAIDVVIAPNDIISVVRIS